MPDADTMCECGATMVHAPMHRPASQADTPPPLVPPGAPPRPVQEVTPEQPAQPAQDDSEAPEPEAA